MPKYYFETCDVRQQKWVFCPLQQRPMVPVFYCYPLQFYCKHSNSGISTWHTLTQKGISTCCCFSFLTALEQQLVYPKKVPSWYCTQISSDLLKIGTSSAPEWKEGGGKDEMWFICPFPVFNWQNAVLVQLDIKCPFPGRILFTGLKSYFSSLVKCKDSHQSPVSHYVFLNFLPKESTKFRIYFREKTDFRLSVLPIRCMSSLLVHSTF